MTEEEQREANRRWWAERLWDPFPVLRGFCDDRGEFSDSPLFDLTAPPNFQMITEDTSYIVTCTETAGAAKMAEKGFSEQSVKAGLKLNKIFSTKVSGQRRRENGQEHTQMSHTKYVVASYVLYKKRFSITPLNPHSPFRLSHDFREAIEEAAQQESAGARMEKWLQIQQQFGTRYVRSIDLGGRKTYQMSYEETSELGTREVTTVARAAVEGKVWRGRARADLAGHASWGRSESQNSFFNSMQQHSTYVQSGGSTTEDTQFWLASIQTDPNMWGIVCNELGLIQDIIPRNLRERLEEAKCFAPRHAILACDSCEIENPQYRIPRKEFFVPPLTETIRITACGSGGSGQKGHGYGYNGAGGASGAVVDVEFHVTEQCWTKRLVICLGDPRPDRDVLHDTCIYFEEINDQRLLVKAAGGGPETQSTVLDVPDFFTVTEYGVIIYEGVPGEKKVNYDARLDLNNYKRNPDGGKPPWPKDVLAILEEEEPAMTQKGLYGRDREGDQRWPQLGGGGWGGSHNGGKVGGSGAPGACVVQCSLRNVQMW